MTCAVTRDYNERELGMIWAQMTGTTTTKPIWPSIMFVLGHAAGLFLAVCVVKAFAR